MSSDFVRFSLRQRLEHLAVMSCFTTLAITGFPQKFYDTSWAHTLVSALGGVGTVRAIHRVAGVLFTLQVVLHFAMAGRDVLQRNAKVMGIVPTRQDFRDAIQMLRYYLGLAKQHPRFDRFDYRQKFEYWGMVMGSMLMVVTGFILLYPTVVARYLPGEVIPASKVGHSQEGLMAFLVVIVWHIWNAHLSPDVFPADNSIFTGRISRERMLHEHPLELARAEGRPAEPHPEHPSEDEAPAPPLRPTGTEAPRRKLP
jgi:formate dehydrogenase subunit gamma